MRGERLRKVRDTLFETADLLEPHSDEPDPQTQDNQAAPLPADRALSDATSNSLPSKSAEPLVLCVAAYGALDQAACAMLSQLLQKHGFRARAERAESTSRPNPAAIDWQEVNLVCVAFLQSDVVSPRLNYVLEALRKHAPGAPIVLFCWDEPDLQKLNAPAEEHRVATTLRQTVDLCVELLSPNASARPGQSYQKVVNT